MSDAVTTAPAAAAAAPAAPAAAPAQAPDPFGPVPYARFHEVNTRAGSAEAKASKLEAELAGLRTELEQVKDRAELTDIRAQLGLVDDGIAREFRARHKAAHADAKPDKVPTVRDWVAKVAADPKAAEGWPKGLKAYFPEPPKPAGGGHRSQGQGPTWPRQDTAQPDASKTQDGGLHDVFAQWGAQNGVGRRRTV
jgi:hypothetical protein